MEQIIGELHLIPVLWIRIRSIPWYLAGSASWNHEIDPARIRVAQKESTKIIRISYYISKLITFMVKILKIFLILGFLTRLISITCRKSRENFILFREGRWTIKISIFFSPYYVLFSGFKSAINKRQMYFMIPLKPTSRCERISKLREDLIG